MQTGDGAGMGKGRTMAGIIFENYRKNRTKAIWISVSNDLKPAAKKDLSDINAPHIDLHQLNEVNVFIGTWADQKSEPNTYFFSGQISSSNTLKSTPV